MSHIANDIWLDQIRDESYEECAEQLEKYEYFENL